MDVTAFLIYGLELPLDLRYSDDDYDDYAFIEEILYGDNSPYTNLEAVRYSEDGKWLIGAALHRTHWLDDPQSIIRLNDVDVDKLETLSQLCAEFDITYEPCWHLGCEVSI